MDEDPSRTKPFLLERPSSSHVCEGGDYKEGDGTGGTEISIGYAHSPKRCVEMVRSRCPTANGATLPSSGKGQCYCEEGMSGWNSVQKWQSCKFAATDTTTTTSVSFTHICEGGDYQEGDGIEETEHNLGYADSPDLCIQMVRFLCPTANGATLPSSGKGSCYCEQGMTDRNSKKQWQTCKFVATVSTTTPAPPSLTHLCEAGDYKEGDGIGGTEQSIGYAHSPHTCIKMVRKQCPMANGATLPSSGNGQCYCEWDMNDRNSVKKWQSCKFPTTDAGSVPPLAASESVPTTDAASVPTTDAASGRLGRGGQEDGCSKERLDMCGSTIGWCTSWCDQMIGADKEELYKRGLAQCMELWAGTQ